jgi:feruloyl esterase
VEQGDPVVWPAQQFYPFKWAFGADFAPASFDFDRDLDRLDALLASPLNANSADLSAFARRGGKLMLFSGLADPAVPFEEVVNYYERVVASRGDLPSTQSFARLFLVPGMGHCFGGPGVTDFGQPFSSAVPPEQAADGLMTLVEWSETGVAPNTVIATKAAGRDAPTAPAGQRPLCAYPKLPEYTGGDPENLSSFRCVERERGSPMTPAARYLN